VSMVATRVDKSAQPASLFTVPADYKMMGGAGSGMGAAPARGAGTANNAGAMDPAEMAERMQNASPEERQKMIEEMKKRYGAP
jgi:hypothetical protein